MLPLPATKTKASIDATSPRYVMRDDMVIHPGSMSTIKVAECVKTKQLVCLKEIKTSADEISEDVFLSKLKDGPHIIPLLDVIETPSKSRKTLVTPKMKSDLHEHLMSSQFGLKENKVLQLGLQLARALQFCHSKGVAHLDIKPDNVLMDSDGNAYLADFGLAEMYNPDSPSPKLTAYKGSFEYISPQVARMEPFTPEKTDVWSLGVLLFTCATCRSPFKAKLQGDYKETLWKIKYLPLQTVIASVSGAPNLRALLKRMLVREEAERDSIENIVQCLELLLCVKKSKRETQSLTHHTVR